MHRILAQDSGGGLLPDWLADAPPWLQLIALLVALIAAMGTLTAPVWGPALADRIRGRPKTPEPVIGSSADQAASTTTATPGGGSGPEPVERYDAKMAVIERLLVNVEKDQELDRAEISTLRGEIADLERQLRARDATIAELRRTIDQLLSQPRQGPTAP